MDLHIFKTHREAVKALAEFFVTTINAVIIEKGSCNVVLSGGNSPKSLYQLLAAEQYQHTVEWSKIFFFFGDERNVPFEDKDNNGRMANENLFKLLNIDTSHIFYIDTSLQPGLAASKYSERIKKHFNDAIPQFDFTLLGIGDNAHTASLFPYTTVLHEKKELVSAVYVDELKADRITMTASLINQSHTIAFLAYGSAKAPAVFNILKGQKDIEKFPAQLIESDKGTTHWFIDQEAAALLLEHQQ